MGLSLQFPNFKHFLVTFPAFLSLQINTHFDPYVLLQEWFFGLMAPIGVFKVLQVITLIGNMNNYVMSKYLQHVVNILF